MKKILIIFLFISFVCSRAGAVVSAADTVDSLCGQAKGYLQNYIDTGKVDERWAYLALDSALKARKLDESSAFPHLVMGQVFIEMGELDKASERVKQAARIDPANADVAKMARILRVRAALQAGGLMSGLDDIEAIEYSDGSSYIGGVRNGKREGYGLYSQKNGVSYVGTWKGGKKHGHGTYVWPDGQKYVGEWVEDVRTGHGKYNWTDNNFYIGQFYKNMQYGHGKTRYPDGLVYIGEMDKGKKHGHGKLLFTNKEVYVGEFRNDIRYGHGVYTWLNKNRYVGMWENTRAMGGYLYWPNGITNWSYQDENNKWINRKQKK